jgi:hypothetical protein
VSSIPSPVWVTHENADAVLTTLAAHTTWGLDSEFDNVELSWQSPVCAARCDVVSLAVPVGPLGSGGFHECASWVVPSELLGRFKAGLENPAILKVAHNLPMEAHTLRNAGIKLRGGLNTLSMARFVYPERANLVRGNFDLDSLCHDRFGRRKTEDFDELFGYDDFVTETREMNRSWCLTCEGLNCKKKIGHPHEMRRVVVPYQKKLRKHLPLYDVRPGHQLFERYKIYSAVDAVLAFQLYELMLRDMERDRPYPWEGFL